MRLKTFCIHRDTIGALKHVQYDSGKLTWHDDLVTPEWVFDKDEGKVDKCLKTLLKVNGVEVSYSPGAVNQKVYAKILPAAVKCVPWSLCLPSSVYKETIRNFFSAISLLDVDDSYYRTVYESFRRITTKLKPFLVDEDRMRNIFEDATDSLMSHLESMLPGSDGFVQPPQYNFFGTRTGRLTITSGPMILTLPKEHRGIILPTKKDSRVIQVDFSSLEPRFLSALAKIPNFEGDLYEEVSRTCFSGNLPRDKTKVALLGILYGMSVDTLSEHIKLPVDDCRVILTTVKKHFKIKEIVSRIDRETYGTSSKNYFGRMIEINRQSMLNNFVQSSGMDVVHMGFDKLLLDSEFMSIPFRPFFLVHDALVGEIPNSSFESLEKLVAKGFYSPQLDSTFPMTISDFAKPLSNSE